MRHPLSACYSWKHKGLQVAKKRLEISALLGEHQLTIVNTARLAQDLDDAHQLIRSHGLRHC